jgi:hypothetical protein
MLPASFHDTVDLILTPTTPSATANASMAVPHATISVNGQEPRPFTVAARISPHVRHQHKYMAAPLPPERRFYFHTLGEAGIAATLEEFSRHLRHCDPAILAYHSPAKTSPAGSPKHSPTTASEGRSPPSNVTSASTTRQRWNGHGTRSCTRSTAATRAAPGTKTAREKKGQASGGCAGDLTGALPPGQDRKADVTGMIVMLTGGLCRYA